MDNKDYIFMVDGSIEELSKQVKKLQRKTSRLRMSLLLSVAGGIYICGRFSNLFADHIAVTKRLKEDIEALKEDKE